MKSLRELGLGNRTVEYAQASPRRALQSQLNGDTGSKSGGGTVSSGKTKESCNNGAKRICFLNPDEARKFLDVVRGDRHEALYTLDLTTGLRPRNCMASAGRSKPRCATTDRKSGTLQKRRKKGEPVPRFQFGPPKTEKSRRTIDFPEFVRAVLVEERRRLMESRALAVRMGGQRTRIPIRNRNTAGRAKRSAPFSEDLRSKRVT